MTDCNGKPDPQGNAIMFNKKAPTCEANIFLS
jgi:hypothetical protein